ncbi:hypothetical protein FHX08_001010 [Rhizobium sp. BK529]|uniref:hypothetical protein n=1 Tax=unclassified Rhizobium TaxID=2613769 RepID=UPI001048DF0F|nr:MULTISPECIES: hypothetical protein [unclassified Rhizobium]MBB3590666.1 hypothetical protein [Rhizobium sp. BK529]
MKPLHYLLIIFAVPPLIALAVGIIIIIALSFHAEQSDPRPTGTIGVKKGDRIGSPSRTPPPPAIRPDFQ